MRVLISFGLVKVARNPQPIQTFKWIFFIMMTQLMLPFRLLNPKVQNDRNPQCGKFIFFYHLDFTWNWFWWFCKCIIWLFNTFRGPEFWFLWIFALFRTFWRLKFTKLTNSELQNGKKQQFYNLWILQNWLHVKSEWQKNL